jgi:hypothetical protein
MKDLHKKEVWVANEIIYGKKGRLSPQTRKKKGTKENHEHGISVNVSLGS